MYLRTNSGDTMSKLGDEIDYVHEIFPHIQRPSPFIIELSRALWELLTYKEIKTPLSQLTSPILGRFEFLTSYEKEKVIFKIRQRIESVNRYKISDEELLKTYFKKFIFSFQESLTHEEILLVHEIAKNPFSDVRSLSKNLNKSPTWVNTKRNALFSKNILRVILQIDPTYFGLKHKVYVFPVLHERVDDMERILSVNPYLIRMVRFSNYYTPSREDFLITSFFVPMIYEAKFKKWIRTLLQNEFVSAPLHLDIERLSHTLNIKMYDGKNWIFDPEKDTLWSYFFTRNFGVYIPDNETTRVLRYVGTPKKDFTYVDLLIASIINLRPFATIKEIIKLLEDKNIYLSKSIVSEKRKQLLQSMLSHVYLSKCGLNSSMSIYIWQPRMSNSEKMFLHKYFTSYFPQVFTFDGNDGFYAVIEFPSSYLVEVREALVLLREYYDDVIMYDMFKTAGRRAFAEIIDFWNESTKKWVIPKGEFQIYLS